MNNIILFWNASINKPMKNVVTGKSET